MPNEAHYRLLKVLEQEPHLTQRDLADRMGVSLGKVNYCIKALLNKGWVKGGNFYRSRKKKTYLYKLTPSGVAEKARLTKRFLAVKIQEFEALEEEIHELNRELEEETARRISRITNSQETGNQ